MSNIHPADDTGNIRIVSQVNFKKEPRRIKLPRGFVLKNVPIGLTFLSQRIDQCVPCERADFAVRLKTTLFLEVYDRIERLPPE